MGKSRYQTWVERSLIGSSNETFIKAEDLIITQKNWRVMVDQTTAALWELGLRDGDRVAIISENQAASLVVLASAALLGLIIVPLNIRLTASELYNILVDCNPKLVIIENNMDIMCLREFKNNVIEWRNISFPGNMSSDPEQEYHTGVNKEKKALLLIYTAAIAGKARGAIITHENLFTGARQITEALNLSRKSKVICVLPFFHIAGLLAAIGAQISRCFINVVKKFDPLVITKIIAEGDGDTIGVFSPMLDRILETAENEYLNIEKLRCVYGAANKEELNKLKVAAPKSIFYTIYGQTECGIIASKESIGPPDAVGRALAEVNIRIVDETGLELKKGSRGIIQVKAASVSPGFWGEENSNMKTIRPEWHDTGDMGLIDLKNELWFLGPADKKRLIKSGGENVYPYEVVEALKEHPDIIDAMVVAIQDDTWGEVVGALCVISANVQLTLNAIRSFLEPRLARYKQPKIIKFIDKLPISEKDHSLDIDAARKILIGAGVQRLE